MTKVNTAAGAVAEPSVVTVFESRSAPVRTRLLVGVVVIWGLSPTCTVALLVTPPVASASSVTRTVKLTVRTAPEGTSARVQVITPSASGAIALPSASVPALPSTNTVPAGTPSRTTTVALPSCVFMQVMVNVRH